ncbi:hypothetical protein C0995_002587 [Termitomyces sp. Mi166|nr:hypothetical protein C0995_002587 [Termitomyces sp. Mi166\
MAQAIVAKPSLISSLLLTVSNHFKPHRTEALQRIRTNAFSLVLIFILSNLLPLPTIQRSLRLVISNNKPERWSSDWLYKWFSIIEVTLAAVFAFNLLQGVYAVQYPRTVPPTPERQKSLFQNTTNQKRSFKVLSPNSSPQLQKAFSMSQSASFTGSSSTYPTSPLSTPSRVVHYPSVAASSTNTNASSTSTMLLHSSPSPVITAYRGHSKSIGRALDESFLGRIPPPESDNEDEA